MELRDKVFDAIFTRFVELTPRAGSTARWAADAILDIPEIKEALEMRDERVKELDALYAEAERLSPTTPNAQ